MTTIDTSKSRDVPAVVLPTETLEQRMVKAGRYTRLVVTAIFYGAVILDFLFCLHLFRALPHLFCKTHEANDFAYCNWYNVKCVPRPAGCDEHWQGWIAGYTLNFRDIVKPDFGMASILGWGWWIIQLTAWSIGDVLLFLLLVIRMPFIVNPLLWMLLAYTVPKLFGLTIPSNPLLDSVRNQMGYGDARTARADETHTALIGGDNSHKQRFRD